MPAASESTSDDDATDLQLALDQRPSIPTCGLQSPSAATASVHASDFGWSRGTIARAPTPGGSFAADAAVAAWRVAEGIGVVVAATPGLVWVTCDCMAPGDGADVMGAEGDTPAALLARTTRSSEAVVGATGRAATGLAGGEDCCERSTLGA